MKNNVDSYERNNKFASPPRPPRPKVVIRSSLIDTTDDWSDFGEALLHWGAVCRRIMKSELYRFLYCPCCLLPLWLPGSLGRSCHPGDSENILSRMSQYLPDTLSQEKQLCAAANTVPGVFTAPLTRVGGTWWLDGTLCSPPSQPERHPPAVSLSPPPDLRAFCASTSVILALPFPSGHLDARGNPTTTGATVTVVTAKTTLNSHSHFFFFIKFQPLECVCSEVVLL